MKAFKYISDSLKGENGDFRIQTCAFDLEMQVLACLAETDLPKQPFPFNDATSLFEIKFLCLKFDLKL